MISLSSSSRWIPEHARRGTRHSRAIDHYAKKKPRGVAASHGRGSKTGEPDLSQREWETPEGDKRSKVEVVARQVEFLDPPTKDAAAPASA